MPSISKVEDTPAGANHGNSRPTGFDLERFMPPHQEGESGANIVRYRQTVLEEESEEEGNSQVEEGMSDGHPSHTGILAGPSGPIPEESSAEDNWATKIESFPAAASSTMAAADQDAIESYADDKDAPQHLEAPKLEATTKLDLVLDDAIAAEHVEHELTVLQAIKT
jgi:hypothetical protein